MDKQRQLHGPATRIMSVLMILIGIVLLVRTIAAGGGAIAVGVILGVLFILAGAARLYLQFRG
jgi:uncharacterized membrane protein HdeD (DUF308 family)